MPDVSPGGLALESFGAGIRVGRVWRGERGFLDRLAPDSPPARSSLALTPGPVPPPVRSVSDSQAQGGASAHLPMRQARKRAASDRQKKLAGTALRPLTREAGSLFSPILVRTAVSF